VADGVLQRVASARPKGLPMACSYRRGTIAPMLLAKNAKCQGSGDSVPGRWVLWHPISVQKADERRSPPPAERGRPRQRPGRATVQNKANLRGVSSLRFQVSSRRGHASNHPTLPCRLSTCRKTPYGVSKAYRAKQSQFVPPGGWWARPALRSGGEAVVRNKANFDGRDCRVAVLLPTTWTADRGKRAKQSQTWGKWDIRVEE